MSVKAQKFHYNCLFYVKCLLAETYIYHEYYFEFMYWNDSFKDLRWTTTHYLYHNCIMYMLYKYVLNNLFKIADNDTIFINKIHFKYYI